MPPVLREFEAIEHPEQSHVDEFKEYLDGLLSITLDQPTVPDLNKFRSATTNSLVCQIPVLNKNDPASLERYQQVTAQKKLKRQELREQHQQQLQLEHQAEQQQCVSRWDD